MLIRINREQTGIDISELKQYANIFTADRDAELEIILHSAISAVEDKANTSITTATYQLSNSVKVSKIKLYNAPISEVVSVLDNDTGEAISYTLDASKRNIILSTPRAVLVTYKTIPVNPPLYDQLKSLALEVAAAYYDGVTDNQILTDIYNKIPKQW